MDWEQGDNPWREFLDDLLDHGGIPFEIKYGYESEDEVRVYPVDDIPSHDPMVYVANMTEEEAEEIIESHEAVTNLHAVGDDAAEEKEFSKVIEKRRPSEPERILEEDVEELRDRLDDIIQDYMPAIEQSDSFNRTVSNMRSLANDLQREVRESLQNIFDDVWEAHINEIEDRHGFELPTGQLERKKKNLKRQLMQRQEVQEAINGIKTRLMGDVDEELSEHLDGVLTQEREGLLNQVKAEVKDIEGNLTTLVRTEMGNISRTARTEAYEEAEEKFGEEGEWLYDWKGPSDHRTTETCEEIKSRIPDEGVPLQELKQIVDEVASEHGFNEFEYPTPHYNCRHQPIRTQNRKVS